MKRPLCYALLLCPFLATMMLAAPHDDLPANDAVRPQLYATGFEFAEGPAFDADGNLYVVNYRGNGKIGRITPDGTAGVFCDLGKLVPVEGKEPKANGLKVDKQGRLVAADAGAGRLLRIAADGKTAEVLADSFDGKPLNAINDVALDPAGNIYFSDPGGSNAENPVGSIYRYDVKTNHVVRLGTGFAYPNGLGLAPDGKHFCLSESDRQRMLVFDVADDGRLTNRRVLIQFPTEPTEANPSGKYIPDGFVFDAAGRIYVGTWTGGTINVVDVATGKLVRQYDAGGSRATNCHFYKGDLYVTVAAKEAVFRLALGVKGYDYNAAADAKE